MLDVMKPSTETNHGGGVCVNGSCRDTAYVNVCCRNTVLTCDMGTLRFCKYRLKGHHMCVCDTRTCVSVCVCKLHAFRTNALCVFKGTHVLQGYFWVLVCYRVHVYVGYMSVMGTDTF